MSPSGIFVGLTAVAIQAEIDAAMDRIRNGDRTSLSGGGKSSSKNYSMSAEQILIEARYALRLLNGTRAPSRTYFDVREIA